MSKATNLHVKTKNINTNYDVRLQNTYILENQKTNVNQKKKNVTKN